MRHLDPYDFGKSLTVFSRKVRKLNYLDENLMVCLMFILFSADLNASFTEFYESEPDVDNLKNIPLLFVSFPSTKVLIILYVCMYVYYVTITKKQNKCKA